MMNNEEVKVIKISEEKFENDLCFISGISGSAKNKGKSVLFRKVENKLIMCTGGIKHSVAMVSIDIEGDAGEFKGFVDGSDIIERFSGISGGDGNLEIRFNLSKSYMELVNLNGKVAVPFDVVEDVVSAENAEIATAKYRNEMVERAYRLVRDVQSMGKIQLSYKDFLDLEKAFKIKDPNNATDKSSISSDSLDEGKKYIEFKIFEEVQKVKMKIQDPNDNNIKREVFVDKAFPIIEGVRYCNTSLEICRKYGQGLGLPQGNKEMKMIIETDVLSHVGSGIKAMKEDSVIISRGVDEICIASGRAKFIYPVKDVYLQDVRPYFGVPYTWKISVDATELKKAIKLLNSCLDKGVKLNKVAALNKMIILPRDKKILFTGIGLDGLPVERYLDYEMATNDNGEQYKDFDVQEIPLNLHRKYIREFLEPCKSKKVSFGIHTYKAKRKMKDEKGLFIKDAQNKVMEEEYQGKLISMEGSDQGIYGVHHRIKI